VHGKESPPKACHRAYPDVRVADGNHHVKRGGSWMAERSDHPLEILHFPLRSAAQFDRKIRQGTEALQANTRVGPSTSAHWRQLYRDYFLQGRLGEYYSDHAPTAEQIEAGLANGTFTEDPRIREALRRLDPALVDPDHA
jgi:hypothetical protein